MRGIRAAQFGIKGFDLPSKLRDAPRQQVSSAFQLQTAGSKLPVLFTMPDVHHETVFFSGHVQGVGFRYSVLQVAKEFEVTGFVRNLADGRVQLDAEGTEADVAAFISSVEEKMHGYIRKVERSAQKRPPQYSSFAIK
jgi:acylphosphatase